MDTQRSRFRFTRCARIRLTPPGTLCTALLQLSLVAPALALAQQGGVHDPERIYGTHCAVCHGEAGDGRSHAARGLRPAPRDFTTPGLAGAMTRASMIDAVRHGRPGSAMVGWESRLDETQIEAVVDFIRVRYMSTAGHITDRGAHAASEVGSGAAVAGTRTAEVITAGTSSAPDTGATLYARHCAVCHGDRGGGATWGRQSLDPPPRDFTTAMARRELTRERMIVSVTHGRPGTAMSAWSSRLTDDQIAAVVDFIDERLMATPAAATRGPRGASTESVASSDEHASHRNAHHSPDDGYPGGLSGDPVTGGDFYRDNCAECHGLDGDGDGPRAYFITPKPRNFRHPGARETLDRAHLFSAVRLGVYGREMPAWGKVLTDQQIADVSEYVYRAFLHDSLDDRSRDNDARANESANTR